MRTLYVSDLDGTLLGPDQKISNYSAAILNHLVEEGLLFSYATARSFYTSCKVTSNLTAEIPVIVHNGVFIEDSVTREKLLSHFFEGQDFYEILQTLLTSNVAPIVYACLNGEEKFSYEPEKLNPETLAFLNTRRGDGRDHPVSSMNELFMGQGFYFTCIDTAAKLKPLFERFRSRFYCIYSTDIYTGAQWLEIIPPSASKAQAALWLKKKLGCDRLVAFGDALNDIPLFTAADESYAVANAAAEVKAAATGIIASNAENGVAQFLNAHALLPL